MSLLSRFFKKKEQVDVINFEKLFILIGLYKEVDKQKIGVIKQVDYKGEYRIHRTRFNKCLIAITDFGYIERFRVPYSFTKEDIEGLKDKLELQTNKSIDIDFISTCNGAFFDINVYNHKLKTKYDFELIKPKNNNKIVVSLGYGHLGIVDFEINKHIGLFGESGSGKSTLLKTILTQLVLNYKSNDLELYLSDNKGGTELNIYSNIEHCKAFTKDINGLKYIFKKLNKEAETRYNLLFDSKLESISEYNNKFINKKLPTIFFVIEEFVSVYKDKTIKSMLHLALSQWRSIGIFLIITTQRPSAKVLDGDLKANIGTCIGLKTLDSNNSNIVIDRYNLLNQLRGNGHAYIRHDGKLKEFQSFYIDHTKVKKLIKHLEVKKDISKNNSKDNIIPIKNIENEGYNNNIDNKNNKGEVKDFGFLDDL